LACETISLLRVVLSLCLKRCTCTRICLCVCVCVCVPTAVMSTGPWDAQRQGSLTGSDSRTSGTDPRAHLQHTHIKHWTSGPQADPAPLNNVRKQHAFRTSHPPVVFPSFCLSSLSLMHTHTHTRQHTHSETPSIRPQTNEIHAPLAKTLRV